MERDSSDGGDDNNGNYKQFEDYNVLSQILLHLMKPFSKKEQLRS